MTSKRDQTGAAAAAGGLSGSEFMLSTIPANHNKSLSNASSYASFRGEKQVPVNHFLTARKTDVTG